jgi:hypothetical protein
LPPPSRKAKYQGVYRGVYPIKVNQQQEVIEEITRYGRKYHYGLEAGSKPELIAALAYMHDPQAYIVCNGYKDEEFIDLALYAQKMGLQVILVLEMPSELELILEALQKDGRASHARRAFPLSAPKAPATGLQRRRRERLRPEHLPAHARRGHLREQGCSIACACFTTTRARRSPTSARSVRPSPRPLAFIAASFKKALAWASSISAVVWPSVMTDSKREPPRQQQLRHQGILRRRDRSHH